MARRWRRRYESPPAGIDNVRSLTRGALALLALAAPLAADAELAPFGARYAITWHGMSAGNSSLELSRLGEGRWSYESQSQARGLFRIVMPAELSSRSVFRLEDGRIVPESFTAEDGAKSSEKDQSITFDWAAGRVRGIAEKKPVDLPAQPGLLDTLSVQVALMHALLEGRTPERFVLFDTGQVKDYVYTREGTEKIRSAVGEHETIIFRSSRPGSKKGTYFWCAPALGYIPLKVERRDGRDVEWSMALRSLDR